MIRYFRIKGLVNGNLNGGVLFPETLYFYIRHLRSRSACIGYVSNNASIHPNISFFGYRNADLFKKSLT